MQNTLFPPILQLFPIPRAGALTNFLEIAPGEIVDRRQRRLLDTWGDHTWLLLNGGAALPREFDQPSLAWALRTASLVIVRDEAPDDEPRLWDCQHRHTLSWQVVVVLAARSLFPAWRARIGQLAGTGAEIVVSGDTIMRTGEAA